MQSSLPTLVATDSEPPVTAETGYGSLTTCRACRRGIETACPKAAATTGIIVTRPRHGTLRRTADTAWAPAKVAAPAYAASQGRIRLAVQRRG